MTIPCQQIITILSNYLHRRTRFGTREPPQIVMTVGTAKLPSDNMILHCLLIDIFICLCSELVQGSRVGTALLSTSHGVIRIRPDVFHCVRSSKQAFVMIGIIIIRYHKIIRLIGTPFESIVFYS